MNLYDLLQLSVGAFSVLAAGFWLQSATNKLPKLTNKPTRTGSGAIPEAITTQSRWSAAGAAYARMAAFSQSLAVLLPYAG